MSLERRAQSLRQSFARHFGAEPTALVQAPGRVNLIGEHTDYNEGFVLPCAIDFQTLVAARARSDRQVHVVALDVEGRLDRFALDGPIVPRTDADWANYVRGTVASLKASGWAPGGADIAITGNVPQGAGLSSSAALEVAVATAFKQLRGLHALSAVEVAQIAQRAENDFVGCRCGIMDQLISACGVPGHALLIDCRSLQTRAVALPPQASLLIVHSNVRRGLVASEYNLRRRQCEAAARHFGVAALRDLDAGRLRSHADGLDATTWRRARHIVTENQRTCDAADALAAHDLARMGRLMAESHASMRDDFEITHPSIDALVEIVGAAIGNEGGVRMTGGGFGGCVVALAPAHALVSAQQRVAERYRSPEGLPATAYLCRAAGGAGLL